MKTTERLLAATTEIWKSYNEHPFVLGTAEKERKREKKTGRERRREKGKEERRKKRETEKESKQATAAN